MRRRQDSHPTVHLSKRVRALLAHSHKLRVSAAASSFDTSHSSAAAIFQLRAPWAALQR